MMMMMCGPTLANNHFRLELILIHVIVAAVQCGSWSTLVNFIWKHIFQYLYRL